MSVIRIVDTFASSPSAGTPVLAASVISTTNVALVVSLTFKLEVLVATPPVRLGGANRVSLVVLLKLVLASPTEGVLLILNGLISEIPPMSSVLTVSREACLSTGA